MSNIYFDASETQEGVPLEQTCRGSFSEGDQLKCTFDEHRCFMLKDMQRVAHDKFKTPQSTFVPVGQHNRNAADRCTPSTRNTWMAATSFSLCSSTSWSSKGAMVSATTNLASSMQSSPSTSENAARACKTGEGQT